MQSNLLMTLEALKQDYPPSHFSFPTFFAIYPMISMPKKDVSSLSKAVSCLSCLFTTGGHVHVDLIGEKRRLSLELWA